MDKTIRAIELQLAQFRKNAKHKAKRPLVRQVTVSPTLIKPAPPEPVFGYRASLPVDAQFELERESFRIMGELLLRAGR